MATTTPALVADPELVTAAWLTDVLRHDGAIGSDSTVSSFTSKAIGTGQVGANVRYELDYEGEPGPASLVCKFSSRDPISKATGVATMTYDTEVAFYRDLADTVDISRPHCYFHAIVAGTADVVIALEDLTPAEQGDQIAGCTVEQATLAVEEAARLHGPRWGDTTLHDLAWLDRRAGSDGLMGMLTAMWDGFVDRYRDTLEPVTLDAGSHLVSLAPRIASHAPRALTPIHYDYRLDNMLFGTPAGGRPLAVVDWQTVQLGLGPADVAYFLGNAFDAATRRSCERELVGRYHAKLVGYGVDDYPLDECWDDYRRSSFASLMMAVFASMMVGRTDRGDTMFMAMA
ncbi:MAG: hypothetical protein QOI47_2213, partial [Actinomycetota bacterium]|nr:hypothetical protein [Actinomycetota bacterium]